MARTKSGDGEMPANAKEIANNENAQAVSADAPAETENEGAKQQPEFRLVQPEYSTRDEKTIFKDVGAVWKNVSQKTGREFYTLKIGKLRLLMFPNQKLEQGGQ